MMEVKTICAADTSLRRRNRWQSVGTVREEFETSLSNSKEDNTKPANMEALVSSYSYEAVDAGGVKMQGSLEVADQSEAVRRIKEMGLFPTKIAERNRRAKARVPRKQPVLAGRSLRIVIPWPGRRVNSARLTTFTRQLATLIEAGMPLLRGLRILQEQEPNRVLRSVIGEVALAIENGSSLAEALSAQPRVFNRLYVNMVRAGEIGGSLEVTLTRLAEFMEKARKIKGRIKAALFYTCAVLVVASGVVSLLMLMVVPRFQMIFEGLLEGAQLPAFTRLVLGLSEIAQRHFPALALAAAAIGAALAFAVRTSAGAWGYDRLKLALPLVGVVFRKAAISRFARTLGTLVSSGVPILQALTIVKETAGNLVVGGVIATVHERVKEGDPIAPTLRSSSLFPAMVAGMVDVGEQTGALPDMLLKIADNYDDEVDNSVNSLTSLLEPILIVTLAVIVGSIVIALFLPLIHIGPAIEGGGAND